MLPRWHNDSCFMDVILVSLFYPKNNYIDFHLLSKTQLHCVEKNFVFGATSKEDIEYRLLYQDYLQKVVMNMRHGTNQEELTQSIIMLRNHHKLSKLYQDPHTQQDAISFLQQLLDILQIVDNKLHANVYKKQGQEWILSSSNCNDLSWIWDVLDNKCTKTSDLLHYEEETATHKTFTYCTISHSVVIFYFHPNNGPPISLDDILLEKYTLRSFIVYLSQSKTNQNGHYISFYKEDQNWIKYDDTKTQVESFSSLSFLNPQFFQSVVLAFYTN